MMASLRNVSAIRSDLIESHPKALARFEALLVEALDDHDYRQVERLIEVVRPLLNQQPYLRQWSIYARGIALRARRDSAQAIALWESLRAQGKDLAPGLYGRVLNSLGIAYEVSEQWDKALSCYHQAEELYQAAGDTLLLGGILLNMAIVYDKGLDYAGAGDCAERSIALLKQNPDDKRWQLYLGAALNQLGMTQGKQGHLDKAREALEVSVRTFECWGELWWQGIARDNLANVYKLLGETEKAETYYHRGLELAQQAGNQRQVAEGWYNLAELHLQTGASLEEIEKLLSKSLTLAQRTNNHEIITDIFLGRAELQDRLGNTTAALEENRQAVRTVEELRSNITVLESRIRLQGSRIQAYEQMVNRLCNLDTVANYAKAFYYAEMCKSRALIEMLAGRPLRPPSLEQVPARLLEDEAALRHSLDKMYRDADTPRKQIDRLEAKLNQVRQRISLADAEFGSFQTVHPLTLEEVQSRLPADGVLLEYFTVGQNILAFVVTPREIHVKQLPLKVRQLQRAFKRAGDARLGPLHRMTRGEDYRLRGFWMLNVLYQKLVEPLGQAAQSAPVLCIVPHGLLHYVPFHALYQKTAAGPRYLVENGVEPRRIIYAPSATALLDYCQRKPPAQGAGCLALGYDNGMLTQAESGAQAIVQMMGGKSHTGSEATRLALMTQGANYRYVHLSCHGRFNAVWPATSSLTLADGTLDVADVLRELHLNAELVCLSACETGRSHILQGDELIGLARAFLYAGTPSVVVSHWVVDEISTRLLMDRFYHELLDCPAGQSEVGATALALGRAQNYLRNLTFDQLRHILQSVSDAKEMEQQLQFFAASMDTLPDQEHPFHHPYYWAPFFLVGDRLGLGR